MTKIWVLPSADGIANQVLKTNGSGALSWHTPTTINNNSDNRIITGSSSSDGTLEAEANLTYDGINFDITCDDTNVNSNLNVNGQVVLMEVTVPYNLLMVKTL